MLVESHVLHGIAQETVNLIMLVDSSSLNQLESNEITDEKSVTAASGLVKPVTLNVIRLDVKVPDT